MLNYNTSFPPTGDGPYAIDRSWCLGDSLPYLNANSRIFDDRTLNATTALAAASATLNTTIASTSSTLSTKIDTLSDTLSANIQQAPYTAKAWVNFNGTNGNIRSAYKVTNVTRNAEGIYTVTMPASLLQDTNYIVSAHAGETDGNGPVTITLDSDTSLTTTTFRLNSYASGSVRADRPIIMAIVYGY